MATGNVPITAGSGTPIRVVTNAAVDSGANQQVFSLAGSDGTLAPFDPDGTLQVSPEATTMLLDDFSGSLTNWTTGGTAPATSGGAVTTSSATTASASSYMRTSGQMILRAASYLRIAFLVRLEASPLTNNTRWWGYGQNQTTPTAAAPVLNGAVFMVDFTDGSMKAATYSAGTRNNVISLTRPSDNAYHRYEIFYRQSIIYWTIDGVTVATQSMPNLAVANNMYGIIGSANYTTSPSSGPSLSVSGFSIADQSGTNRTIADGASPWIQATVKNPGSAVVSSDLPLVVGLHPSTVGIMAIGAATPNASYYTSTTTNAATVAKTSAGNIQALVISNGSASTQWVKVYNATSVTLGTTAAVLDVQVAAGATFSLATGPNGVRMTTGIAFAVTGATGATNNTAGAGGVLIALTYV